MGWTFTPSLVPKIFKSNYDEIASEFLTKYWPEALKTPMAVPIWEIAQKKIQLQIITTEQLSENLDVLGAIALCDGVIGIYDPSTNEYVGFEVKKGMAFIDCFINHEGRENNTLAHECVHWFLHRPYFIQQEKKGNTSDIAFRCPIRKLQDSLDVPQDEEWMEIQARGIAPKILMPKAMFKKKSTEILNKHGYVKGAVNSCQVVKTAIDELAAFFCVSKQSAKIRMLDFGYEEAQEFYTYENGDRKFYPRDKIAQQTSVQSQSRYLTRQIGINEAFDLYRKNGNFHTIIESGQFCYVDGHFVINDAKYVQMADTGAFELTEYAKNNPKECILNFTYRLKSRRDEHLQTSFLYRYEAAEYEKVLQDTSNTENDAIAALSEELRKKRKEFDAKFSLQKSLSKTCWQRIYEIMQAKHIYVSAFTGKTHLHENYYYHAKNNYASMPDIRTIIAICAGLDLDIGLAYELLALAGHSLSPTSTEHQAYSFIITGLSGETMDTRNTFLQSYGIPELGTKSKK